MARITNINNGGTVGAQTGNNGDDENTATEVTNINEGGTVGIQAGTVTGNTVNTTR